MDVETAAGIAGAGVTTVDANWAGEERLSITQTFEASAAGLEHDGFRRNRLKAESCSGFKSVDRDSAFKLNPSRSSGLRAPLRAGDNDGSPPHGGDFQLGH